MPRTSPDDGPHPADRHVGRRVAEKRILLGLSQTDLARALGLSFQQVQKYETGANRLSASKLWLTAQFLGVEVGYFFTGLSAEAEAPRGVSPEADNRPTRQSVEITRLARHLSSRQQKLALDLMMAMSGRAF